MEKETFRNGKGVNWKQTEGVLITILTFVDALSKRINDCVTQNRFRMSNDDVTRSRGLGQEKGMENVWENKIENLVEQAIDWYHFGDAPP